MNHLLLSVVIPTHNRPHLLPQAVNSALAQTVSDLEVIVVDDASAEPVQLPEHPQVRVIRLEQSRGGAGARNVGTDAARGRWIMYLDDDDRLLPHMASVSLEALEKAVLPPPVAVISGIEVVNSQGKVLSTRIPPPARPKGSHFSLEPLEAAYSYNTKQTMVVERQIIQQIGGWDESFRSRVHSELFLRLNPVCSIIGLPTVTYQLYSHEETRVSRNSTLRQESFYRLIEKHRALFEAHPQRFAQLVFDHACISRQLEQNRAALLSLGWAFKLDPFGTSMNMIHLLKQAVSNRLSPISS